LRLRADSKNVVADTPDQRSPQPAATAPRVPHDAIPSWRSWPPSAQRPHPAGDGPPDLVRRIFLNEMDPRHRLLGQRWPPADKVDQPIIGEDRTWLNLQEQLGHIARPQPVRVFSRDRSHIGGLALDGYLPGPRQRRPSPLARLGERPS